MNADALKARLRLGRCVIGYVGRFAAEKGLDTLVRAVEQVSDGHLLLIGSGPLRVEIESRAAAAGMNERLTFVGSVPHHEVPLYLNAMDVLVLPSLTTPIWKEQFGHVLIEAMACGTPVIGSDSGAIPEVVESAGLIFPEGDSTALAGLLQRLASSRDERHELSRAGLERVRSHYTHERIAERTLRIYQAMTRDKAAGQSVR
jgi:glycosyltransferase involved in cell wall biosynthesis